MAMAEATPQPFPWEPRIVAFLCYWCSYTGADAAGTARLKYPPNVDIIRVMCSGRIDPELVTAAFARGADGVMVCGCHIGDCHYIAGTHKTMARMPLVERITRQVRRLGPLDWPRRMHERGVPGGRSLGPWAEP
jgi:coenzyme F420-reducing hydrogenase delta subunit